MAENLSPRLRSGLATVKQWEADKELLKECRQQIPFHLLCPEQFHHLNKNEQVKESPYGKDNDNMYKGDDLLLKRLALYFKGIMTWVNNPPCDLCGSTETKCRNTRGPMSREEREGQASRVEVYWCPTCNAETTLFPRYNLPRKLLETKKGRCGEYANLFGLYCRAAGFDTRYILDFTDHVWTEIYSNRLGKWIMCDGCEGVIDEPAMYEKGWGKDLNCILAFTTNSVVDVTRRYTRKSKSAEFQQRRRAITNSEFQSELIIAQFNANLRNSERLPVKQLEELDRRLVLEKSFLESTEKMNSWDDNDYCEGRQSGSLEWRISRGESGYLRGHRPSKREGGLSTVVHLSVDDVADLSKLNLRCEENTVPSSVSTRLPDIAMPFASQLNATIDAKKKAFLTFVNSEESKQYQYQAAPFVGFCTKPDLPIYLITHLAYPFQQNTGTGWKTFHFVPDSLQSGSENEDMEIDVAPPQKETRQVMTLADQRLRVAEIFHILVGEGIAANEACAKAIQQVALEVKAAKGAEMEVDTVELNSEEDPADEDIFDPTSVDSDTQEVVLKYISNIEENPSTQRFRLMKFGNKIFDQVTSSRGGLQFVLHLGFDIYPAGTDFVAVVPLATDLTAMKKAAEDILKNS